MTRFGLTALAALLLGCVALCADDVPSIRRVTVNPARPPEALRRADDFVRMRTDAFDRLMAGARDAAAKTRSGPQIVAADYALRWADGRLLGAAKLVIHRARHDPSYLRLEPFGGALQGPATFNGQPAVLGEVPGVGLALATDFVGRGTLAFSWSLRAEARPDGHSVFLQLPAAPTAELSVSLPAEHWLEFPGNRQLAPRLVAKDAEGWQWRVALGSGEPTEAEALIRPAGETGKPTLILARPSSEHEVTLAGVASRFEFDLEAVHGRLSQVVLDADAALEITQAALKQPEAREVPFERRVEAGRATYVLSLPAGIAGRTLLELRGRADMPALKPGGAWSPPWLRMRGTHTGREAIRIRTAPSLRLADWHFGDFQPAGPWQTERRGAEVWDDLRLVQSGLATARPALPVAHLQRSGDEVAVRQEAWWHVSQERSQFVVRSWWQVLSGRVGRLLMSLPAGWEVEDMELSPASFLRQGYRDALAAGAPLAIELREPIDAGVPVRVTLRLRPSSGPLASGANTTIPVPHVAPLGARWVQTQLGITLERGPVLGQPLWTGTLRGVNVADAPQVTSGQLWSPVAAAPDFYVSYFGRASEGVLGVAPAPPRFAAQATTELHLRSEGRTVRYEARLLPRSGSPERVTLELESPPGDLPWTIADGGVNLRSVQRSERGAAKTYEFHFDRPASGPVVIRGEAPLPPGLTLALPLLRCVDDPDFTGRLVIHGQAGPGVRVPFAAGLTPCEPTAREGPSAACYRHGSSPRVVHLAVQTVKPLPAVVSHGLMCLRIGTDGTAHCTYRCLLRSPHLAPQSIALPPDATLVAAEVEGEPYTISPASGALVVQPRKAESRLRLEFTRPMPSLGAIIRLRSEQPTWSEEVVVHDCRTIWQLPAGWVPYSDQWVRLPGPRSLRALWRDRPRWAEAAALAFRLTGAEPEWTADWLPRALAEWQRRRTEWRERSVREVLLALDNAVPDLRYPLVVDLAALGEAGIDLDAKLNTAGAGAPWELAGLTLISCRDSLLLTTSRRLARDEAIGAAGAEWTYGRFLAEAMVEGRDSSGRFAVLQEVKASDDLRSAALLASGPGLTGWESLAAIDGQSEGLCAPVAFLWMIGAVWGVGIALAGRRFATTGRGRAVLALLGAGSAAIALLWLPQGLQPLAWCQLLGLLAALPRSQHALAAFPRPLRPARLTPKAVAGALAIIALLPSSHIDAQNEATRPAHTVYLLPPAESDEGELLAPRELVARLEEMARNVTAPGPPVALLAADYRGEVVENDAFFDAAYEVHVLHGEEADVPLPLRNVRLISAHVDEVPTPATPLPGGDGFVVRVMGRGRHRLTLRWAARVSANGGEQEVRLGVPPVTRSALLFEVAAPARGLRAGAARGGQTTRTLPRSQALRASLGRTSELSITWRTEPEAEAAARVRETYAWQLNAAQCRLQAYLEYEVLRGTLDGVAIELPAALAVQSVEVRALNLLAAPPHLADWRVDGRRLFLRFAAPTAGRFGVLLTLPLDLSKVTPHAWVGPAVGSIGAGARGLLAPAGTGAQARLLHLAAPVPVAAERQDGLVGLLGDLPAELVLPPGRGWSEVSPRERADVWPAALAPTGVPARLYRFQRSSPASTQARVYSRKPEFTGSLDVNLELDAIDVEVHADVYVQVERGELALLTLQVPPELDLVNVSGDQVLRHTQLDGHVQIWFRTPVLGDSKLGDPKLAETKPDNTKPGETRVHLRGWLRTTSEVGRSPRLKLPRFAIAGSTPTPARLSIRNSRGLDVLWERSEGFTPQTGPFPDDVLGVWLAMAPEYAGQLRLRRRPRPSTPPAPPATTATTEPRSLPARVVRADYLVRPTGLTRAICTASYIVTHGPAATLVLEPPGNVRLLAVVIEGRPVASQAEEGSWRFTLPGESGVRCLDVIWELQNDTTKPLAFAAPRLKGQTQVAGDLLIQLPPGLSWTQLTAPGGRRVAAEIRLRRSEALLAGLEELIKQRPADDARWTQPLRTKLGLLDAEVDALEGSLDLLGAAATARVGQARRTLDQLVRSAELDLRATRPSGAGASAAQGVDTAPSHPGRLVWVPLDTSGHFELPIEAAGAAPRRHALWLSVFVGLIIALLIPVLRRERPLDSLKRAWPEIAVLAGFAWWLALPGWLVGVGLLGLGIGGRLLRTLRQLFATQAPELPSTVSSPSPPG